MKKLILFFLILPSVIYAQPSSSIVDTPKGIIFQKGLTWEKLLEQAKAQNKYIFLDCYTTWCQPCKAMEKEIYPLEEIGEYFNENFISVKVQFDRTGNDDDEVRSWYGDSKKIEEAYLVDAYPTYIFFSPDGKPVHRSAGAMGRKRFLAFAKDAFDPLKQSYSLSKNYQLEKMDTAELKKLARTFRYSNPEFAGKIVIEYFKKIPKDEMSTQGNLDLLVTYKGDAEVAKLSQKYINSLSIDSLFSKPNIVFMAKVMKSSTEGSFRFFYNNCKKVESIINKGKPVISWYNIRELTDDIIFQENVRPVTQLADSLHMPDWQHIFRSIQAKYNSEVADRILCQAKYSWAKKYGDWNTYVKYLSKYINNFNTGNSPFFLNDAAWNVFIHCNNLKQLQEGLKWSYSSFSFCPAPGFMDTYANLLYKLGYKNEAIDWEKHLSFLDEKNEEYKITLEKMKKDIPTWPTGDK